MKQIALQRRLVDIYKRGPLFTTEAMLSARSFGELVARYKYLHLLALRDRSLVTRVEQLRDAGAARARPARDAAESLSRTTAATRRAKNELRALEHERSSSLVQNPAGSEADGNATRSPQGDRDTAHERDRVARRGPPPRRKRPVQRRRAPAARSRRATTADSIGRSTVHCSIRSGKRRRRATRPSAGTASASRRPSAPRSTQLHRVVS